MTSFCFYNFLKAPHDFRSDKHFSHSLGKTLSIRLYFKENLISLLAAFLSPPRRLGEPPQGYLFMKVVAIVI